MVEIPAACAGSDSDVLGISFKVRNLGPGVHALMASPLARDNSGLIVGSRAALMVEAGINDCVVRELRRIAARLTDRPLRYLINTSCLGSHQCGNFAFAPSVSIIAPRSSAAVITGLAHEKVVYRARPSEPWTGVVGVARWRKPDRLFEHRVDIDLGGRIVQVWYFGPGHTTEDTIVYEPSTRTAWTGNLIGGEQRLPVLLETAPLQYIETLVRLKAALRIDKIVPGYGPQARPRAIDRTIDYLWGLHHDVKFAFDAGMSPEAAVEVIKLRREHQAPWFSARMWHRLLQRLHRVNVLYAYRDLQECP